MPVWELLLKLAATRLRMRIILYHLARMLHHRPLTRTAAAEAPEGAARRQSPLVAATAVPEQGQASRKLQGKATGAPLQTSPPASPSAASSRLKVSRAEPLLPNRTLQGRSRQEQTSKEAQPLRPRFFLRGRRLQTSKEAEPLRPRTSRSRRRQKPTSEDTEPLRASPEALLQPWDNREAAPPPL